MDGQGRAPVRFARLVVVVALAVSLAAVARAMLPRVVVRTPRLGVLNLVGDAAAEFVSADLKALAPLFGKAIESTKATPACDVLFLYVRVLDSGVVDGSEVGLREIIRDSGATVAVVATENSVDAYIAGAPKKSYGRANLVMTLQRRGSRFQTFFARLFRMMFAGQTMPVAWVKLAPQVPGAEHDDTPSTIFAAEAGQVSFK